jgi:hypothetical protein
MGEPILKDQDPDGGVYEFVCVRCGITESLTLTSCNEVPQCRCGSPLSPIALVADTSADWDVCGEAFLNEFCQESSPHNDRYDGLCLVQGRGAHLEEDTDEEPGYSPSTTRTSSPIVSSAPSGSSAPASIASGAGCSFSESATAGTSSDSGEVLRGHLPRGVTTETV